MNETPVSTCTCDLCGKVETVDRPIRHERFELREGDYIIAICWFCTTFHVMPWITGQRFPRHNLEMWRDQLEEWVKKHGKKAR